ncbi:tripartite tricarboxylate transporter TctB family protein [Ornithinimicrobium faecis]|uniref:tripartite tricarboxylate transporter TctB family protein n=1 Tax=Ornithinimicrobium faecis TaxID=2934158 RepID=UPI0021194FDF|nr:tripartite tricarboxylate transporter TctB family protein [Ornithinimicrobium sp. HY1745]
MGPTTEVPQQERRHDTRLPGIHRVSGLVLLALGVFALTQSLALGVGELVRPGPGLWPLALSVVLCVLSVILVVIDSPDDYEPWSRRSVTVLLGVASLLAFVLVFETVGFVIAAFLMLVLWLRVFGGESWGWTVGLALVGAIGFQLLFVNALGVPFPDGILQL